MLIGEMRDLETIETALVVAETGHLVFSTLHTNSAVQTINRIIDVFPPYQQPQVRAQLSVVLGGRDLAAAHPAHGRQGPRARRRGDDPERRDPQPDPRGEGPSDLLADAGRTGQARHADDEPVAAGLVPAPTDHVRRSDGTRHRAGRAPHDAHRRSDRCRDSCAADAVHHTRRGNFAREAKTMAVFRWEGYLAERRGHAGRDGGRRPATR